MTIDHAFTNTIDPNKTYVVLLTPEGDSDNVYVTNRTAAARRSASPTTSSQAPVAHGAP